MNLVAAMLYSTISLLSFLNTPMLQPVLADNGNVMIMEITAYTSGFESTGKNPGDKNYGITFSGIPAKEGITVAVDPDIIPLGSMLYIKGIGYRIAQDTGSAIKGYKLDLFMNDVNKAWDFGRQHRLVYVIKTPEEFQSKNQLAVSDREIRDQSYDID